jgi:hypothetical protein
MRLWDRPPGSFWFSEGRQIRKLRLHVAPTFRPHLPRNRETVMTVDPFEAAMIAGAINALRRRAEAIRARASVGVTRLDQSPVVIITSESATALRIAKDFDRIADDLAEAAR